MMKTGERYCSTMALAAVVSLMAQTYKTITRVRNRPASIVRAVGQDLSGPFQIEQHNQRRDEAAGARDDHRVPGDQLDKQSAGAPHDARR